jgi:putative redox protein
MEAKVTFSQGLQFVGRADSGHALVMDGPVRVGGSDSAPRPSELLLLALAGCTGMDVVSILRKKRQQVSGMEITVSGEQKADHPARFEKLAVTYVIRGEGIDPEAVRRAIQLSEEKYCSVGATLREGVEITSGFEILHPEEA